MKKYSMLIIPAIFIAHHYVNAQDSSEKPESIYGTKSFENIAYQVGKPVIAECIGDDFTTACASHMAHTLMVIPVVIRNDSDYSIDINDYEFFIINEKQEKIHQSHGGQSAIFMSGEHLPPAFIGPNMQAIDYEVFEVDKNIEKFELCVETKTSTQCNEWDKLTG